MKELSILLLMCAAASNTLPVHPEKDNKEEDAKLVQVITLFTSQIY